ncbi:sugar ABC transporter permease [bacterium AH-315-E10]|nr:sugar ABC transporter permease [bacterium AH-315-E10]
MNTRSPYRSSAILLLLPFFIILLLLWLVPLSSSIYASFQGDSIISVDPPHESVGLSLDNYQYLLSDSRFHRALANTFIYAISLILLVVPGAFILAHLLMIVNKQVRPFFSFGLLIPSITPPIVLGILFLLVFHGRDGILNQFVAGPLLAFLKQTGGESAASLPDTINWLKDPHFILPALIIQGVWRWLGLITLFFLCGLESMPTHLDDAAEAEGASLLQHLWHVTIPSLKHIIIFSAIYLAVDACVTFAGAYTLLGNSGGTNDAGLLIVSYSHQTASIFQKPNLSTAISLAIIPFIIIAVSVLITVYRRNRRGEQ